MTSRQLYLCACRKKWNLYPQSLPFPCLCGRKITGQSAVFVSVSRSVIKEEAKPRIDCKHLLSKDVKRIEECTSCQGKGQIKVLGCALHGECSILKPLPGVRCCQSCSDYRKYEPITIRNLIYHVCPLIDNDGWRQNVRQLVKRFDVFNGQRVIAIAQGDAMEWDQVHAEFRGENYEFFYVENDRELREVASFLPLLEQVANTNHNEAVFYGHTKGNSTAGNVLGSKRWTAMMYDKLLTDWQPCMKHLEAYPSVGVNKMVWGTQPPPYPSRLQHGNWMSSGTFWWARHDVVFSHPKWREVPRDRYGAEAWLSGLMEWHELKSVYQKWPETDYPTPSPYNPDLYPATYDAEWEL